MALLSTINGNFNDGIASSYMCMEDSTAVINFKTEETKPIDTFQTLLYYINSVFACGSSKAIVHKQLLSLLERVDLTTNELNKYTFWDSEKPYTRNLVGTDGKNFTLLLLCWSPGKESKIHNHPCDGCYFKTVRGCIRECQYHCNLNDNTDLKLIKTRFFNEGQVSYLTDEIGLHKIGNPFKDSGSVSLHLYTPPFQSCKVFIDNGNGGGIWEDSKLGLFSIMGHRSPHLEGKPGIHFRLIAEIKEYFNHQLNNKLRKRKLISALEP